MRNLRMVIHSTQSLFAFEAAGRLGSFTRAAQELHVSQPAISQSIRLLEANLGVALFTRGHRRADLTEAGEKLFHDVSIGLGHIARSVEQISRRHALTHVTLSCSTAFAN
jgi:DNA-binding transcriptional LysR family regulator